MTRPPSGGPGSDAESAPQAAVRRTGWGTGAHPVPRTGGFAAAPHPSGPEVVGSYVHSYDPAPRPPYQHHIPGMRPPHETPAQQSPTPIYDALYAEYRRQFRALPGDRTGEEDLGFAPFNTGGRRPPQHRAPEHRAPEQRGSWDRVRTWDPQRQNRPGFPPALPPGQRDNRRHGL